MSADFTAINTAELAELRRRVAAIEKLDAMNLRELAETHERCPLCYSDLTDFLESST